LINPSRLAYWLGTNLQSQPNEYDLLLARHMSPKHTLLNLQAADVLRETGFQVNLTRSEIKLPDGGLFRPELTILDDQGAAHFVELKKIQIRTSSSARPTGAISSRPAVEGCLCYATTDPARGIFSMVQLLHRKKPLLACFTNLADLQTRKRGDGDCFWLEVKHIRVSSALIRTT